MSEASSTGDVVQVKSGGPPMTVSAIGDDGEVDVARMSDKHEQRGGRFDAAVLKPYGGRGSSRTRGY